MSDVIEAMGMGALGNVFYSPQNNYLLNYQQLLQQQRQSTCIHGSDCPSCLEIAKKNEEAKIRREEMIKQKRLAYELRCKKYMEDWRKEKLRT